MKIGDEVYIHGYIDEIRKDTVIIRNNGGYFGTIPSEIITGELPSAQTEQIRIIKEIRKWINSGNRGSADYFIVDKIEEIINKYE